MDTWATILTLGGLVAADRILKLLAEQYLTGSKTLVLIPGILGCRLLPGGNSGAAFGILGGKSTLLIGMSLLCSLILLYLLLFKEFNSMVAKWSFILIAAGAMGNLYDRMVYHSVTDYLEFLFFEFPVFNLADVMVDVGAALYIIYVFFLDKGEPMLKKKVDVNE